MGQANLKISFTQGGLKKITEDLKKIRGLAKEVKVGGDEAKQKNITKENAKQLKLTEQEIQLKTKLITVERLQYSEAAKEAKRLLNLNKEKNVITRKQWLNLQKITAEDKLSVDISKKKIEANEMIKKQDEQILTTQVKINKLKSKKSEANEKIDNTKTTTIEEQRLQLQTKLSNSKRLQYSNSEKEINSLLKLNEKEEIITRKQWLNLGKITEENKVIVDISKKKIEANEMIKKQDEQRLMTQVKINKLKSEKAEGLSKVKESNSHDIKKLRDDINSSEIVDKKKFMGMLDNLNKKSTDTDLKRKLSNVKETFDQERTRIVTLSKLAASKEAELKKQKHMLSMMEAKVSGKSGYDKLTAGITKYQNRLKLGKIITKDEVNSLKLLNVQLSKNSKTVDRTTMSFQTLLMGARRVSQVVSGLINEIGSIDESIYNLGVVSGKSAVGVEVLKRELVLASTAIPKSATDMATSMDLVVRTGRSLQQAQELTNSSMKLAVASGEDLNYITETMAKTLVAFSLDTDIAAESIDSFYSAVLKTPLSIRGLSLAMRNSASAFATLINFTGKSGEELEAYKVKLLNLNVAMTAGFATMGVTSSKSGRIKCA